MASEFEYALGLVAPVYNLVLALIALFLFMKLFGLPNRLVYLKPWHALFAGFCVYLIEESFTVLRKLDLYQLPYIFNGFFEMIIISLFIYMLFLQREHIMRIYKRKHH